MQTTVHYFVDDEQHSGFFYLPFCVLNLTRCLKYSVAEFKKNWRDLKQKVQESEDFNWSGTDIQSLIPESVVLNYNKKEEYNAGIDEIKFGLAIHISGVKSLFLLKIIVAPTKQIRIQSASKDDSSSSNKYQEELVNTLMFSLSS